MYPRTATDQRQLAEIEVAWLLFPAPALRALERLAALSRHGLVTHGSFSLSANYHALCGWAEAVGGRALVPDPGRGGLHTVALLRLPEAADHRATAAAWRRHLAAFGPGDYLKLSQLACSSAEQLSAEQLLAFLRLGQGDSHLFGRLLPRLQRLAADLQPQERLGLLESAAQVGRMQFPLDGREAEAMEEGFRALRQSEARSQPQAPQLLALERELDWLAALVQARVERLFHRQGGEANLPLIPEPPSLPVGLEDASPWAQLVNELAAEPLARLALALLLAAQLRPAALDPLQVAYLLQRLESFKGVVILATNLPTNMDEAFLRRFESVVYFPLPGPEQRLRLWREAFSERALVSADLEAIAEQHELSGGLILNVVRRVSLQAIARGNNEILEASLLRAIRRELEKEGKGV